MIEISIAVIAAAFVILVIYLAITLWSLHKTLCQLKKTLENTQRKLDALDSLFEVTSLVGEKVVDYIERWEPTKYSTSNNESSNNPPPSSSTKTIYADIAEWLAIGINLWLNIKKRR